MKIAVLLLIALMIGCSSHDSYNQRTSGRVVFRGGVYKNDTWDEKLEFKRMSWYHGMTLYYDTIIWKADPTSPFAQWFSSAEKQYFARCESLLVTAGYSADPNKISHVNFREQMKLNGYDDVVVNTFARFLKTHPSAQDWRLQNYKVMGYCKRSPTRMETSNLAINFPSFKQLEVDL